MSKTEWIVIVDDEIKTQWGPYRTQCDATRAVAAMIDENWDEIDDPNDWRRLNWIGGFLRAENGMGEGYTVVERNRVPITLDWEPTEASKENN